ncbi:MAG: ATP synthase F1 subunit gamma [Bacteroidota bacterium]|jgi:F-type H+-transporting ATPase subunit gamma
MPTLRDIRRRISGIKNTQKITKAMKMVSAAKLRRAQDAIVSARPYARKLNELLQHLSGKVDLTTNPLFAQRPVKRLLVVVVTADRGLCGAFNSNIIRTAVTHIRTTNKEAFDAGNIDLLCVGRKGAEFFSKRQYAIAGKYVGIFGGLNFSVAQTITGEVVQKFLGGECDRVEVIYNEFKSIMRQHIVVEQLLPVPTDATAASSSVHKLKSLVDYIYEPSREAILASLLPKHFNFQMWRMLLESNAAEQGARMTAMDSATTNASELIHDLQLSYNNARQASITKELLEIVAGAEALRKAG